MNRYGERDLYVQAGDWLVDTARRKPEALLLLAAGCALLMRKGRSSDGATWYDHRRDSTLGTTQARAAGILDQARSRTGDFQNRVSEAASSYAGAAGNLASNVKSQVANTASDLKNQVSEAATSYAASVGEYADHARQTMSEASSRLGEQAQSAMHTAHDSLRDQPLLVAAVGLAAGAAVAAFFPATDLERRTLGEAREVLADAASKAGENLLGAAGQAGERLKTAAADRGLNPEGLKELARDVTETFTSAAAGKVEEKSSSRATKQTPGGATDDHQSRA